MSLTKDNLEDASKGFKTLSKENTLRGLIFMEIHKDVTVAIIGGVGFELEGLSKTVKTPYGDVEVRLVDLKGEHENKKAVFISRHGKDHLPPHKVNYRAVIWAARKSEASRIISVNTVGTMSYHDVGSFFLPADFVEFTRSRINTFFDDRAVHVDMSQPYCPELVYCLEKSIHKLNMNAHKGVYVCSEGPHLETPATIRMMRQFGDVVGMTGYPEVVLARELGLCYASLCIITNEACGMKAGFTLSLSDIRQLMDRLGSTVGKILAGTAEEIPPKRGCSCCIDIENNSKMTFDS